MMKMLNAMVSHDLMGPIINAKKFADQLRTHVYKANTEEVEKYHSLIIDLLNFVSCRMRDFLD